MKNSIHHKTKTKQKKTGQSEQSIKKKKKATRDSEERASVDNSIKIKTLYNKTYGLEKRLP